MHSRQLECFNDACRRDLYTFLLNYRWPRGLSSFLSSVTYITMSNLACIEQIIDSHYYSRASIVNVDFGNSDEILSVIILMNHYKAQLLYGTLYCRHSQTKSACHGWYSNDISCGIYWAPLMNERDDRVPM